MRIKRYEAPTIQEALVKVKKDLGPEAVILYTKTFRKGGVLGLFGKHMAEITAGLDLNLLDDFAKRKNTSLSLQIPIEKKDHQISRHNMLSRDSTLVIENLDPNRTKVKALQRELNEMKTSTVPTVMKEYTPNDTNLIIAEGLARFKKKMVKQEIEEFLIQRIVRGMINEKINVEKNEEVQFWLQRFVSNLIKVASPLTFNGFQKVIAFVGPTGVGKTTTLAKLAAKFSLVNRKKVTLITSDTYRIAATEQLKTYGRIMGIPVEVANSSDEIEGIIERHKGVDLVLLDTAGRSPSNNEQLDELKLFITKSQPDEIHLVLSSTTKYYDMIRIIECFGLAVPINRMIFTKLDETRYYGAFLNLMNNFQIPLSYYATGQNVPDDLEIAEVNTLSERIVRSLLS